MLHQCGYIHFWGRRKLLRAPGRAQISKCLQFLISINSVIHRNEKVSYQVPQRESGCQCWAWSESGVSYWDWCGRWCSKVNSTSWQFHLLKVGDEGLFYFPRCIQLKRIFIIDWCQLIIETSHGAGVGTPVGSSGKVWPVGTWHFSVYLDFYRNILLADGVNNANDFNLKLWAPTRSPQISPHTSGYGNYQWGVYWGISKRGV